MRKYFGFLRNTLTSSLEYRGEIFGSITVNLISIFVGLAFWLAVYRSNSHVGTYKIADIVLYYLLMPIIGALSYVSVSEKLPRQIKDGMLSAQLIKPYRVWIATLMNAIGGKMTYVFLVLPVYVAILWVISFNFEIRIHNLLVIPIILVLSFALHFFMDLTISWCAFWVDDVWSFRHFKNILFAVLGGSSFPLDLLPANIKSVIELLPFQYFFYVPISYLTGKRSLEFLPSDIFGMIVWAVCFYIFGKFLWSRGIKKFGAYGG